MPLRSAIKNALSREDPEFCSVMVPETGLEPARIAAYAPKAYVYTNFTTRAYLYYNIKMSPWGLIFSFLSISFGKYCRT